MLDCLDSRLCARQLVLEGNSIRHIGVVVVGVVIMVAASTASADLA